MLGPKPDRAGGHRRRYPEIVRYGASAALPPQDELPGTGIRRAATRKNGRPEQEGASARDADVAQVR